MGHVLHAVIGPKASLSAFAGNWHGARVIDLPQSFGLVPLTSSLHDDIVELASIDRPDPIPGFERLSAGLEEVLRQASNIGQLAYIETDYFGGIGTQGQRA
jgi:hypothetical protein